MGWVERKSNLGFGVLYKKSQVAFTLSETLIALTVIGVVAAITIPLFISGYQEKVLVNRLKQSYSIFSQAYSLAKKDFGDLDTWNIGSMNTTDGSNKLYKYFTPYIVSTKECGSNYDCFPDGAYKSLSRKSDFIYQPRTSFDYARGVLANGSSFVMWSCGSGCNCDFSKNGQGPLAKTCGAINVDLNGAKKPNTAGIDYFNFVITRDGVLPAGGKNYKSLHNIGCKYNNTANTNGAACTAWVLAHENMDYGRKDIDY